jgi:hypothetical protein
MGTSLAKLGLYFHKVSSIVNTRFPPLRETLYAGRVKLFAEASELFQWRSNVVNAAVNFWVS